jgi:predicted transposase YbfD/YdcC
MKKSNASTRSRRPSPLFNTIDTEDKDVTADALLTQRKIVQYLVKEPRAHYHFTVKGNERGNLEDLALLFQDRQQLDFVEYTPPDHGRIEIRQIWTTTELNGYLEFPHVGQPFLIDRYSTEKKTAKSSCKIAYGIIGRKAEQADPEGVLNVNRGHWSIENSCHYIIDWNYDEDRSRIRIGYGPENIIRLRRFAIGVIKSKKVRSLVQKMRELTNKCPLGLRLLTDDNKFMPRSRLRKENKFTVLIQQFPSRVMYQKKKWSRCALFKILMSKDRKQNPFHAGSITESSHRSGSSSDLHESSFNRIGGTYNRWG